MNDVKTVRFVITFIWLLSFLAVVFFLWQIDVSVGAISCGGKIFQDGAYGSPLTYYEISMNGVITWGLINLMSSFYLILLRAVMGETGEKRQKHKNSPGK